MSTTINDTDKTNLTRPTHIQGVLIRSDGLVCTFDAAAWLDFCRTVVEQADGLWGRNGGVARVFGCEAGRALEEHALADCRRVVSEAGNMVPLHVQIGAVGQRTRWLPVADLNAASRACRRFIELHDLGASGWRGGRVVDAVTKTPSRRSATTAASGSPTAPRRRSAAGADHRHAQRSWGSCIRPRSTQNPGMLNRTALIVRPAAPYMAWARSLEEGSDVLPDPTGEQTVYLVPSFEGDDDHRVLLTRECGSLRSAGVWWAR